MLTRNSIIHRLLLFITFIKDFNIMFPIPHPTIRDIFIKIILHDVIPYKSRVLPNIIIGYVLHSTNILL